MKTFEFTLKFALSEPGIDTRLFLTKLAKAGCNDAVAGTGQKGVISLRFTRVSGNAYKAVLSAINDVKSAIPDAELVEATPDFVGLSDVAELMGFSRQNLRKLMITHSESFPVPLHSGKYSIWHLFEILQWLEERQKRAIDPAVKEVALANMQINVAKQIMYLDQHIQDNRSRLSK